MIVVLVPSRGRPERAKGMAGSVLATATGPVRVVLIVDADDPRHAEYEALAGPVAGEGPFVITLPEQVGYTRSLNAAAQTVLGDPDVSIVGAFGDDVVFRTPGWDDEVRAALATPGIAYGDDLIHGRNHPSAVFMSREIIEALGWLALPATSHQWADDGWKRLGQATGVLRYMDGVVFEHEHPGVGKAEWDATYDGVFQVPRAEADFAGFTAWVESGGLAHDTIAVRQLLEARR